MPFDGSGNYLRNFPPGGWQGDAAANIKIKADRHDQHDADLASALSNVICKDGQSSPSANIPFNNKRIITLADPVNDQDAVTKKFILGSASTQGLFTKVGFTSADMALVGRAAGTPVGSLQRIAFNDKADATGNDVFVVNDDGTVSSRAADGTQKLFAPATAQARNRIVNGAMQISQEWGNTAVPAAANYPADQWLSGGSHPVGLVIASQRVAVTAPTGSPYAIRYTMTTGAAMAAGNVVPIEQAIEGVRISDFAWGTANAKQIVLRFGFKGPAGTYAVNLRNGAANRSYVAGFTIAAGEANTKTTQTLVIPGDTTGTWLIDTGMGIRLAIILGAGTSQVMTGNVWTAGGLMGLTGQTNGCATTGNTFELFDVGLYLDPQNTGVAPPWQMPDEAEELRACMRYYYTMDVANAYVLRGRMTNDDYKEVTVPHPVTMRTTPSTAVYGLFNYTPPNIGLGSTATPHLWTASGSPGHLNTIVTQGHTMNARM